ncbi:hypothetical protein [Anaerocolumna sp.]|uniref:hypothetical protein n=1 Tax=Anaerocolumna sp. TaxID=2041569 RepID=UPI0028ADF132|nr:hypothetical protein [Anaerocolumna sp.]
MNKIKKGKIRTRTKVIIGVILFLLFKIVSPYLITPREIKELNKNINFPYKLISPLEEFDDDGWKIEAIEYGVMYVDLQGDYIIFEGFPDLSNSYKLTYLSTDNPEFSLFGIRVGDNMTLVDSIMKEKGYKRDKSQRSYSYYKGKIDISFGVDRMDMWLGEEKRVEETLTGFVISIRSSDWFHKGYYK